MTFSLRPEEAVLLASKSLLAKNIFSVIWEINCLKIIQQNEKHSYVDDLCSKILRYCKIVKKFLRNLGQYKSR